jgi:hypothetical protein
MAEPETAADVARTLADTLERHQLSYAIGDAIALGYYAIPRATVDVDINVFVAPEGEIDRLLAVLAEAGFAPSEPPAAIRERAVEEGQFRGTAHGLRVDVFVPAIPYYEALARRTRSATLLGRPAIILGPEDLAVLKMMFFRRKDLADVEALLREQGAALDRDFVRRTLCELAGADDERVSTFDAIVRDVDAGP